MSEEPASYSKHEEIVKAREREYGPPRESHALIGKVWGAMLSRHLGVEIPDLDPRIVALMMAALKMMRASGPDTDRGNEDTYDDLHIYASFAKTWDSRL